jgi:methionine-rich copper-binding protein CopC
MSSRGGSIRRGLAVLVGAVTAVGLAAAPASAHDELLGTDPADGATVDIAPAQVVLTFAEPAVELGTQVLVAGPDGATASEGPVQLVDATVVQALAATRPAGQYHVDWRVTSQDGHVVSGSFAFTATSATAPTASPAVSAPTSSSDPTTATTTNPATPSPSAALTSASTSTAVATPEPSGSADGALIAPAPSPGAAAGDSGRSNPAPVIVLAVLVVLLGAAAVVRNRSLRRYHAQAAAQEAATGTTAGDGSAGAAGDATAGDGPTSGPGEG